MALVQNCLVHLIGLPGVGKLTIARELASALPAHLVDNHASNNLIISLLDIARDQSIPEAAWVEVRKVRAAVLNTISTLAPREANYIFTNALYGDDEKDLRVIEQVRGTIEARGGTYVPVVITCDTEEHRTRYTNTQRHEKLKPTDVKILDGIFAGDDQPLRQKLPTELELDVTSLTPAQAAQAIRTHLEGLAA